MFAPFNPFRCFVPNQFEPAATVVINRHSKQALAYETNQSAGKIDRQQDAEDLQNGKRLLIEGGAADIFLEIVMQPFLGFDDIVPDSSSPATV